MLPIKTLATIWILQKRSKISNYYSYWISTNFWLSILASFPIRTLNRSAIELRLNFKGHIMSLLSTGMGNKCWRMKSLKFTGWFKASRPKVFCSEVFRLKFLPPEPSELQTKFGKLFAGKVFNYRDFNAYLSFGWGFR